MSLHDVHTLGHEGGPDCGVDEHLGWHLALTQGQVLVDAHEELYSSVNARRTVAVEVPPELIGLDPEDHSHEVAQSSSGTEVFKQPSWQFCECRVAHVLAKCVLHRIRTK